MNANNATDALDKQIMKEIQDANKKLKKLEESHTDNEILKYINKKLRELEDSYNQNLMSDSRYYQLKENLEKHKYRYENKSKDEKKEKEKGKKGTAFMDYLSKYKKEEKEKPEKEEGEETTQAEEGEEEAEVEEAEEVEPEEKPTKNRPTPQDEFASLIDEYYKLQPYFTNNGTPYKELEVKFGTKGIKPLTKNDYDNVIIKLKSLGFTCEDEEGLHSLRIQKEMLDESGRFQMSNIRTEINTLPAISQYCKTNSISSISSIKFTKKNFAKTSNEKPIRTVDMNDWNFRVSLQNEVELKSSRYITSEWTSSKKTFRYINRVTFTHPDYPVNVDISIVKNSTKKGYDFIKTVTVQDSGVFTNPEIYEIELEVQNNNIGPDTNFKTAASVLQMLKTVIKWVLSGLQGTNYPVSYKEQREVMNLYMRLLFQENYNEKRRIYNSDFIGPSSLTLQMSNIAEINENASIPNIRKNYTVTEKADGARNLLFICPTGKIYLINTNMQIIFTGSSTTEKTLLNTLIDGELILYDKNGKYINLYAAFDLYFHVGKDVRAWSFIQKTREENSRLALLKNIIKTLEPITTTVHIECKKFYPENPEIHNMFDACNAILTKNKDNLFQYNIDGLIFTPAYTGVGSNTVGVAGPLKKITWEQSFKWKPPEYNTIDFMISTVKNSSGRDEIASIFEPGNSSQLTEYKQLILLCTFVPNKHGYINPCQDVIDGHLPEYQNKEEDAQDLKAVPKQFYPTNPSDPMAGIANILLEPDENYNLEMFSEENELIEDNTIVEFKYDMERQPGWRWVPLRVRYDKTAELRQGLSNYGNAYHVANSNWQSINNPITESMISTGAGIPDVSVSDDVYYNRNPGMRGESKTRALRDFHNLYVKKKLITGVSKKNDTLIDYSCGKGGDFSKWIDSHLSFVFGVDLSKDNLENNLDGACARFLNYRKKFKKVPYALFVNGNSANNIASGQAMLNDKAKEITLAVFGKGEYNEEKLGKGVYKQFGKGVDGFNVSSCQFSMHYFLQNIHTFRGFLKNLVECTKINGYFISTCYDGKSIFDLLKDKQMDEGVQIIDQGKKIWEIVKKYDDAQLEDNSSCVGYKIDVYQESINQYIPEYLVNFTYFNRIMQNYGFVLVSNDEAEQLGFPSGSGLFKQLYKKMVEEIRNNRIKKDDCGTATQMNLSEQTISFLNRYYIYKKIRNVNPDKVEFDLSDYDAKRGEEPIVSDKDKEKDKDKTSDKSDKTVKKIRRINKKLTLQPATEALEDEAIDAQKQQAEVEARVKAETEARIRAEAEERVEAEVREEEKEKEKEKEEEKEKEKEEEKEAPAKVEPLEKKKRCPKGTRKNTKTGECQEAPSPREKKEGKEEEKKEEPVKKKLKFRIIPPKEGEPEIDYGIVKTKKTLKNKKTEVVKEVEAPAQEAQAEAKPEKKKKCPNGTRKNPKTGECDKKPA